MRAITSANSAGSRRCASVLHGGDEFRPDEAGRDAALVVDTVGSGEHVAQRRARRNRPIPHDIETAPADLHGAVRAGHGVADQFLAVRKAEVKRREAARDEVRGRMALLQHAAPGQIADVARLNVGSERPANHGAHPVRADQQIALDPGAVVQDRDGAVAVLLDPGHVAPGAKMPRRKGIAEQVVKERPRRAVLVVGMGGKRGARTVVGGTLGDADADIGTNRDAGPPERGEQRALRHDPCATRLQALPGPLEDLDLPPLANEHVTGEHSGHRTANDNRLRHRSTLTNRQR